MRSCVITMQTLILINDGEVVMLKSLIKQGGLKRGELYVIAMPLVRTPSISNNKVIQLIMENNYAKQDSPSSQ